MVTRTTPLISATSEGINDAISRLRNGEIVALPSETVYGLAGRADDDATLAAIFAAKGRPAINPLIAHVADIDMAMTLAEFGKIARTLASAFWPGALTMVLPKRQGISTVLTANLDTVAIRMPAHPLFHRILVELGIPLAAPSANASGSLSPTTPEHVLATLEGRIDAVLDGGATDLGVESTVIHIDEATPRITILRYGNITAQELAAATDIEITTHTQSAAPQSPGQLLRHYAPKSPLILNSTVGDLQLGFGTGGTRDLSPMADLNEAARNLFAMLHELDVMANGSMAIHVAPIPDQGVGIAINDRLARAANAVKKG